VKEKATWSYYCRFKDTSPADEPCYCEKDRYFLLLFIIVHKKINIP